VDVRYGLSLNYLEVISVKVVRLRKIILNKSEALENLRNRLSYK